MDPSEKRDPVSAEIESQEPDFAGEHAGATHADEHPQDEDIERDESTPDGLAGMDD
ncbi:hypothetical protein [Nocardia veterana]|uniref:Uncharacterized protein n=1 Tax=Nocardia veterana TaxID=132249 RepID=A0A7X6RKV2_9NOCA|nr:hypothetical protein [Nocardia veterana]NKY89752.1 hypothetical protein [Nocardia veterana]